MTPQKAFFALLAVTILVIGAGGGLYYYLNSSLVSLNQDVGELLAEQEVIGTQIQVYEETKQKVEELSFVEDLADEVLPQSKEQANVVAEIRRFVSSAGLQLEAVSFSSASGSTGLSTSQTEAVTSLPGVRVLPVTAVISSGATYDQILDLLTKVESNQRKMQVTEVSLTPIPGSDVIANFTLKMNIYLRSSVAVPAATEAEATP